MRLIQSHSPPAVEACPVCGVFSRVLGTGALMSCALRRNLLHRAVLATDETHSEDESEPRWFDEIGNIHSACGEDEAAPQAERFCEIQDDRSNCGNACFGEGACTNHVALFLAGTPVRNDENVVGNWRIQGNLTASPGAVPRHQMPRFGM